METDYDTDDDGKLDLVKALVQLPRAAMEGDYQAATIYEARPYITGCTSGPTPYGEEGYDISKLYSQPDARTPVGEATTEEVAAEADSSEWYYYNEYEGIYDYEDLTWYDYYLVRGYAVVECGGLGTAAPTGSRPAVPTWRSTPSSASSSGSPATGWLTPTRPATLPSRPIGPMARWA